MADGEEGVGATNAGYDDHSGGEEHAADCELLHRIHAHCAEEGEGNGSDEDIADEVDECSVVEEGLTEVRRAQMIRAVGMSHMIIRDTMLHHVLRW